METFTAYVGLYSIGDEVVPIVIRSLFGVNFPVITQQYRELVSPEQVLPESEVNVLGGFKVQGTKHSSWEEFCDIFGKLGKSCRYRSQDDFIKAIAEHFQKKSFQQYSSFEAVLEEFAGREHLTILPLIRRVTPAHRCLENTLKRGPENLVQFTREEVTGETLDQYIIH